MGISLPPPLSVFINNGTSAMISEICPVYDFDE
jgi:hypothetical protein